MSFLAFLLIGGVSGAASWIFYPSTPKRIKGFWGSNLKGLLIATLLGFLGALMGSYLGQYSDFFQSGQMLEWLTAILTACVISSLYVAWIKTS